MANKIYKNALVLMGTKAIDLVNDDIRVVLLSAGYTFSDSHTVMTSVTSGLRVATSGTIAGRSFAAGTGQVPLLATNTVLSAVTGSQVVALIVFKNTGTDSTASLIAYFDTATNMPVTPNGGNITIAWDATNGVLKLTN